MNSHNLTADKPIATERQAQDIHLMGHTWVASGPAGAIGSVHQVEGGYTFRLLRDGRFRGVFPTLGVAKSALFASLVPGSDWPEFREH